MALHYTAAPILAPGMRGSGERAAPASAAGSPMWSRSRPSCRGSSGEAVPVSLDGQELNAADLERLAAAAGRSRTVRAIWTGERAYPDRSTGHFAFAAALARAGCRDADTIHRAIVALDQRHGRDVSKAMRPDYAARTIAAALAAEARP